MEVFCSSKATQVTDLDEILRVSVELVYIPAYQIPR